MDADPPQHMAPSPNFSQPLASAALEAQPSTYAAIVQKCSRLYLVRLCTVGPLIVLHIVGAIILLLAFMNDVQSYSNSKYSDDLFYSLEYLMVFATAAILFIYLLYPFCHIFGWKSVKNNLRPVWVCIINIFGFIFSLLGIVFYILPTLDNINSTLPTGAAGEVLILVLVFAVPIAELVFSGIFIKHSLWMIRNKH